MFITYLKRMQSSNISLHIVCKSTLIPSVFAYLEFYVEKLVCQQQGWPDLNQAI